jgi:hypothetical protein
MSDASDRSDAITIVNTLVQSAVAPTLTSTEIETEIDRAKLASRWAINTAYVAGSVIVVGNGHAYQVEQPGTSQATELIANDWPIYSGALIGDGASNPQLTWREIGTARFNPRIVGAEYNVYDIERAAHTCWLLKARKSSQFIDADGEPEISQMYKRCTEIANSFRPFRREISVVRA